MKAFWDQRYSERDYAYGTDPNVFFQEVLTRYCPTGKFLLPAEGEGRNAVYAARQGLEVTAFDQSVAGRDKALHLAAQAGVQIKYLVGDFSDMRFQEAAFDGAALIFAHFPPDLRSDFHRQTVSWLKPGGVLILEAFRVEHLAYRQRNPQAGGPPQAELLFDRDIIASDFTGLETMYLEEVETTLREGSYHVGESALIRYVGRKQ